MVFVSTQFDFEVSSRDFSAFVQHEHVCQWLEEATVAVQARFTSLNFVGLESIELDKVHQFYNLKALKVFLQAQSSHTLLDTCPKSCTKSSCGLQLSLDAVVTTIKYWSDRIFQWQCSVRARECQTNLFCLIIVMNMRPHTGASKRQHSRNLQAEVTNWICRSVFRASTFAIWLRLDDLTGYSWRTFGNW